MYYNKVLGRTGGILPKGGKGTFREKNVPSQYKVNLAEPKNISVASGQSASAAPIVAVNKARFDNRAGKTYSNVKSNDNLTYYLDFRDSLKVVSGGDTKVIKPVPTHSKPFHKSMPLFIQACIDTSYSADNALYDNTSKTRKFSTPANGIIVPVRNDLFGSLIDDLKRVSSGQFPVHEEWFDSFGADFTPSRATELLSVITRVSKIISFAKEGNTWLGKGSVHMKSIMNALLIKNLLIPKTYNKQKYYTHMYHIAEQSYDDYQGRAIRGEPKPAPLKNAQLPPLPFPSAYIQDILLSHRQESEAARQDAIRQADMARRIAEAAFIQMFNQEMPLDMPEANLNFPGLASGHVGRGGEGFNIDPNAGGFGNYDWDANLGAMNNAQAARAAAANDGGGGALIAPRNPIQMIDMAVDATAQNPGLMARIMMRLRGLATPRRDFGTPGQANVTPFNRSIANARGYFTSPAGIRRNLFGAGTTAPRHAPIRRAIFGVSRAVPGEEEDLGTGALAVRARAPRTHQDNDTPRGLITNFRAIVAAITPIRRITDETDAMERGARTPTDQPIRRAGPDSITRGILSIREMIAATLERVGATRPSLEEVRVDPDVEEVPTRLTGMDAVAITSPTRAEGMEVRNRYTRSFEMINNMTPNRRAPLYTVFQLMTNEIDLSWGLPVTFAYESMPNTEYAMRARQAFESTRRPASTSRMARNAATFRAYNSLLNLNLRDGVITRQEYNTLRWPTAEFGTGNPRR